MTTGWSVEAERICDATIIERSRHEPDRFADLYDRHAEEIHRYVTRPHALALGRDRLLTAARTSTTRTLAGGRGSRSPARSPSPWPSG
ncbi:hypothetical protein ACIBCT_19780 [Streptosporangium sp. NPDC050855]|uniref:hypothetical protein n=1 Tax=Streptosporangium sp. NPDC050855 TaxID=3366194 RepID=UPI0037B93149